MILYLNYIVLLIPIIVFFFRKALSQKVNNINNILFVGLILSCVSYYYDDMIYVTLNLCNIFIGFYLLLLVNEGDVE